MEFDWDNMNNEQETYPQLPDNQPDIAGDDEWEYVEEVMSDDDVNSTVNEAIKRIEQAKLYESLLKHDFFAPGSAREEIQSKVTNEIRDFILERLTILVGLKEPESKKHQQQLPWDAVQIESLTSISNRLVDKKSNSVSAPAQPVVRQFVNNTSQPQVNVAQAMQQSIPDQPKTKMVRRRKEQPVAAQTPGKSAIPPGMKTDPSTGLPISDSGIVLYAGQAQNKKKPATPMPSQTQMNNINATQVQRESAGTGSIGDKLLGLAITNAQNLNRNITED